MIVYHGTTQHRARRICVEGFLPKKPSRRVWFAESRAYALGRAKTQARRARDRPAVLTCDLDMNEMRRRVGARRVFHRSRVIAIRGPVPVTVLRSHPGVVDQPTSPGELAAWLNEVLGLKPYKGVGQRHAGVRRLSSWVANRAATQPRRSIPAGEVLSMAQRWLPEFLEGVEIDPDTLSVHRRAAGLEVDVRAEAAGEDPREAEAIELIEDAKPNRRVRGLKLLAQIADPDLADWCALALADEHADVQREALRIMRGCDDMDPAAAEPFAEAEDKRTRAAALAALAAHADDAAPWMRRGLRDPSSCVRVEVSAFLHRLDPTQHRDVFELALHDGNAAVAERASRLTQGKGFGKVDW